MPAIIPAIAAELANGVDDAIRQAGAVVTGQQGNWIANGEPESVYGKTQQATARQYCRRYADDPGKYSGAAKVLAENACRPYLDDIGYGSPGSIKNPFAGGQCDGLLYRPSGTFVATCNPNIGQVRTWNCAGNIVGPVNGIVLVGRGYHVSHGAGLVERCVGPNGNTVTDKDVVPAIACGQFVSTVSVGNSVVITASNPQGHSDGCGSPPPDIVDPVPPVSPGPPRERFNPGPDIDIDIGVEINPDGTIDIDFGTGPITIDPFGDDGGGGGGGTGPGPGDVGDPGSPVETGLEGDADGEAPPGTVLTGLRIDFVTPPVGGNEYKAGIYRGVCYVYMGTSDGVDHDPAGAMLRDGQFIFAEKDNLTHWFVSANRGYNLRVTPYYRPVAVEDE